MTVFFIETSLISNPKVAFIFGLRKFPYFPNMRTISSKQALQRQRS